MTQDELKLLHELQSKAKELLPDAHFVAVYEEENTNEYHLCGYHFDSEGMYRHFQLNDDGSITEDEADEWQDPTPNWNDD